jgi:hypothetical protein
LRLSCQNPKNGRRVEKIGGTFIESGADPAHATEYRQIEEQVEAIHDKVAEPNPESDQEELPRELRPAAARTRGTSPETNQP